MGNHQNYVYGSSDAPLEFVRAQLGCCGVPYTKMCSLAQAPPKSYRKLLASVAFPTLFKVSHDLTLDGFQVVYNRLAGRC